MNAIERRARQEAIELAIWLTPISPTLKDTVLMAPKPTGEESEDMGVGDSFVSDGSTLPDLGPLEPLGSWASVAATILRKTESLVGFDPMVPNFEEIAWSGFIYKLNAAPFWIGAQKAFREVNISSLSLKGAVDAIEDVIKNVATPKSFDSIIGSVKKIAQLALENKEKDQKDNFQQQGLISILESKMYVTNIRTSIQMKYKQGKGYEQLSQTLLIDRWFGELDLDKCKRSATQILSWDETDVDEWTSDTASASKPPNNSPAWNS